MTDAILDFMSRTSIAYTAAELSEALGHPVQDVIATLHQMDEAGQVIMRNGFYRLSEAERARRA